jgi:hypothetical protein
MRLIPILATLTVLGCDSGPEAMPDLGGVWEATGVEISDRSMDWWLDLRRADGRFEGESYLCPGQLVGEQRCLEGDAWTVDDLLRAEAYVAESERHVADCSPSFREHEHGKRARSTTEPPDVDHLDCTVLETSFSMQRVGSLPEFVAGQSSRPGP